MYIARGAKFLTYKPEEAGVTFSDSDSAPVPNFSIRVRLFFKFENPTPVQTPATIIDSTVIYPCFYLRHDRTDSCYCRTGKVTPVPVLHKFLTPGPELGPKEKRRILSESTPVTESGPTSVASLCKYIRRKTNTTKESLDIMRIVWSLPNRGYTVSDSEATHCLHNADW